VIKRIEKSLKKLNIKDIIGGHDDFNRKWVDWNGEIIRFENLKFQQDSLQDQFRNEKYQYYNINKSFKLV
jgi:hypothetical protein